MRLLSFNVWHGNRHFDDIARLIAHEVAPDVVNLQEAIREAPHKIVAALNRQGGGTWALANEFSPETFWCGLNVYRSDKWDLKWTKNVGFQGARGACGALLRRKSDGFKLCSWGAHPIWANGGDQRFGEEAVRAAATAMRECSALGGASVFLGDWNTANTRAIRTQLDRSTGWSWKVAAIDGYDQIYMETAPRSAGISSDPTAIAPTSGQRGCQKSCQNPAWAYSDHPPVFVDVHPPTHK